jgi:hypothetical protein
MKKIILTISILVAVSAACLAQCDKSVVLNSSKTEHLDGSGTITRTVDETAEVEISKTNVDIAINGEHKIAGTIKSNKCNWTVPYKEGKTIITCATERDGEEKNFTLTIEGKDGKVTLFFEMDGEPNDKVRVAVNKFTEKS